MWFIYQLLSSIYFSPSYLKCLVEKGVEQVFQRGLVTLKEINSKFQSKLLAFFPLLMFFTGFQWQAMTRETVQLSNQRQKLFKSPIACDVAVDIIDVFKVTWKIFTFFSAQEFCHNLLTFRKITSFNHVALMLICVSCLFSLIFSSTPSGSSVKLFVALDHR